MQFKLLREFFETVRSTKGNIEKNRVITEYLQKFRNELDGENETLFPVLRLILPKLDRERSSYNMKESKISRTITKMLALPDGNDKNLLSKAYLTGSGSDFSEVIYSVLRKYIANHKSEFTIEELNSSLDDIANRQSESEVENILLKVFRKSSPEDTKWIIRIILKDLKIGTDSNKILRCFHEDAVQFYSLNTNLKKVCEVLSKTDVKLNEIEINIFEPFRPMLSKKVDAASFQKDFIEDKIFYIENKFDGERFQLHMDNGIFKYFSRNGFNYTETLGASYESGILTPRLKDVFNPINKRIILDGEMMLWNKRTKKFGSKGMSMDVKKLNETGVYQPCLCVYDVLLIDNEVLTNKPLEERLSLLRKVIINERQGTIVISEYSKANSRQEIVNALNESMDKEEEGIIIKDPKSIYKCSDRNSGWFKMKIEYFSDVMNDLDLVLMGGSFENTKDRLISFTVGIRSGNHENGLPAYMAFGKVTSGLNDEELEMLNKRLKTQGLPFKDFASKSKGSLIFGNETPHYYIEPEFSLIFVVRASELIRTPGKSYKTPYTFRFPRVLKVREDKPVDECLSMNELLHLSQQNKAVIKLNKRNIDLEEILATKTRKIKRPKLVVPEIESRTQVCDYLEGYSFHIFSGSEGKTKENIETSVRRFGGKLLYKIDDNVDIVLIGQDSPKLADIIKDVHTYDVIYISWLKRVQDNKSIVCYEPEDVYKLGCNYQNSLKDNIDIYGDSYTTELTVESLKHVFEVVKRTRDYSDHNNLIQFANNSLHKYMAYFDKYEEINNKFSKVIYKSFTDEMEFEYRRGTKSEKITPEVNLIIFKDPGRCEVLKNYVRSINRQDIEVFPCSFLYK